MKKKIQRTWQMITGIHRIHHIDHGYGYKLPFLQIARFDGYWRLFPYEGQRRKPRWKTNIHKTTLLNCKCPYHNCTTSGVY